MHGQQNIKTFGIIYWYFVYTTCENIPPCVRW